MSCSICVDETREVVGGTPIVDDEYFLLCREHMDLYHRAARLEDIGIREWCRRILRFGPEVGRNWLQDQYIGQARV